MTGEMTMETSNADAIIDFCLAPLSLSDRT